MKTERPTVLQLSWPQASTEPQPMADSYFHEYCQKGNLDGVKQIVQAIGRQKLDEILTSKRGVFGYTPLHEAAVNGNTKILDYLLEKTDNLHVNFKANGGYTPLHVAISSGKKESVVVLLNHLAELNVTDEFGRTPKQMAELNNQVIIAQTLIQEEVFREVKKDGGRVMTLIQQYENKVDKACLNKCLRAATLNNSVACIGMLVTKGADDLDSCLHLAQRERKQHSCALLLLIQAAYTGDTGIVRKLFAKQEEFGEITGHQYYLRDISVEAQRVLKSESVLTTVPIEIALKQNNHQVRDLLLMKTNVDETEGAVNWSNIHLHQLQLRWLDEVRWVKHLLLGGNGFDSLPYCIDTYLTQIVKLDLKHNKLASLPPTLFALPTLEELFLSYNMLKKLPGVAKWPENLSVFNLSHNLLSSLPDKVEAPNMKQLDISSNSFSKVPLCICSFLKLTDLNLSGNTSIYNLPVQMGRLSQLQTLDIGNLDLKDPPKEIRRNTRECVEYLYNRLHNAKSFYHMKILVLGTESKNRAGLVQSLVPAVKEKGKGYSESRLEISTLVLRSSFIMGKEYSFDVWDFGGLEATTIQHCFYFPQALYLLLFDHAKSVATTVDELRHHLVQIAKRASCSMVMFVAMLTHKDQHNLVPFLGQVQQLGNLFKDRLQVVEDIVTVTLTNGKQNVNQLKSAIVANIARFKTQLGREIMGSKVPATYIDLDRQFRQQQLLQYGIPVPIMKLDDLKTRIKQMKVESVFQDDKQLRGLTKFLNNRGSLLFYNNKTCHLDRFMFTDAQWLYDTIATVVTAGSKSVVPNSGLVHLKDLSQLFKDIAHFKHIDQLLVLMDDLEVALLTDDPCLLIPSALQDRPQNVPLPLKSDGNFCYRYIVFNFRNSIHSSMSWSRLLCILLQCIPCLKSAFTKLAAQSVKEEVSLRPAGSKGRASCNHQDFRSLEISTRSLDMMDSYRGWNSRRSATHQQRSPSQQTQSWSFHRSVTTTSLPSTQPGDSQSGGIDANTVQRLLADSIFLSKLIGSSTSEASHLGQERDHSELVYWSGGIYFSSPSVVLQMEMMTNCPALRNDDREGILIMVSANVTGRQVLGLAVDLVQAYVDQWWLLQGGRQVNSSRYLDQRVPCPKCVKAGREIPHEFQYSECLSLATRNHISVSCEEDRDKNHSLLLADLFPDIMFKDMQSDILLNPNDLQFPDGIPLAQETYIAGAYKNEAVLVRTYAAAQKESFRHLHHEAMILQSLQHPCVALLVGVTIYPSLTLEIEAGPLGFLDQALLRKSVPIHRITTFRMAAEVVSALGYLHSRGLVYHNLRAANILLWTLDPKSLCHCKLGNFANTSHGSVLRMSDLSSLDAFTAPEVLRERQERQRSASTQQADIFSFAMFLYQLVVREQPFSDTPRSTAIKLVMAGQRPNPDKVEMTKTSYHYLGMLMRSCWDDHPDRRPKTRMLLKSLCMSSIQSVMSVSPVDGRWPVGGATAITSTDINKIGAPSVAHNEMWAFCNGQDRSEVGVYNTHTMMLQHKIEIPLHEVQHMTLCGEYMWVSIRSCDRSHDRSVVRVYTIACCELVDTIDSLDGCISCSASGENKVFVGTSKGYCYITSNSQVRKGPQYNSKPVPMCISQHALEGMAWSDGLLWISHWDEITIVNVLTLEPVASISHGDKDWIVGSLAVAPADSMIWSAHLGEDSRLSAWNTLSHTHLLSVDTSAALTTASGDGVITCLAPALDTVWVGMSTGHILIYQQDQLLAWHHPYAGSVRFLTAIPSSGPCGTEQCLVVSGGNEHVSCLPRDLQPRDQAELQDGLDYLVVWEAFNGRLVQQVKVVEDGAPRHLDSYGSVRQMLFSGEFKDGTSILVRKTIE